MTCIKLKLVVCFPIILVSQGIGGGWEYISGWGTYLLCAEDSIPVLQSQTKPPELDRVVFKAMYTCNMIRVPKVAKYI